MNAARALAARRRVAPSHLSAALALIALLIVPCLYCNRTPSSGSSGSPVSVATTPGGVNVSTSSAEFRLSSSGYLQAKLLKDGRGGTLDDPSSASNSSTDTLTVAGKEVNDFVMDTTHAKVLNASGRLGAAGKRVEASGESASTPGIEKLVAIEVYDDFPTLALVSTSYKNTSSSELAIDQVTTQQHVLNASSEDAKADPYAMWSFHGSSEAWGKNDVMQVTAKFSRSNLMQVVQHNDENQTGGGIPVIAFWTGSVGEAIGHAETVPLRIALPVRTLSDGKVSVGIQLDGVRLGPGQSYTTPLTFVSVFRGDFFEPLTQYSKMLQHQGLSLAHPNAADYEANWCGWGYEMDFTPKQMLGTIPKLKELGLKWATLDAGWFRARGDWEPRSDTFPDDSLQKVVKAYHDAGLKITVWWIPLVVEDGLGKDILNHRRYQLSKVVKDHPDWLILDRNGKPARATADLGALCPAVPGVKDYYKRLTERLIRDYGFDGHKLDFSYTVPACYNPKHHHQSPDDSIRAVGDVYKIILDTTRALKPESVTQACPCGTPPSLAWLPYIDQAVTADPVGSKQVRLRTKMYKALLGPEAAVYGDHVELTEVQLSNSLHEVDKGTDFASEVGVGAVLGTKFTWPDYGPKFKTVELTSEKEHHWRKWIGIYNDKMLSRGKFLNLYTYGYDWPEAYAIEKDGKMYYAFYTQEKNQEWKGKVELRGLTPGKYKVVNYETSADLPSVDAASPLLEVQFSQHLLLEVSKAAQ
jgi:alpha-galactosidase